MRKVKLKKKCLIPDSNLAHLNSHLELFGQVFYQLPEINSPISRVKKNLLQVSTQIRFNDAQIAPCV
jgi:dihydroorotase